MDKQANKITLQVTPVMHPDVPKFYSNHVTMNSSEHDFRMNFFDVDIDFKPDIATPISEGTIFANPQVRVVFPISMLKPLAVALKTQVEKHFNEESTEE